MPKNTTEKCWCQNAFGTHTTTENGWEESWTDDIGDCIDISSPENFTRVKTFIQHIAKEQYERGWNNAVASLRNQFINNNFKATPEMFIEAALEAPNEEHHG